MKLLYINNFEFMEKKDKYIEENRDFVTASKLKEFVKSPEAYFLKYVKEEESPDKREKKHFVLWTALDDLISYWKEKFNEKYFVDEWLLKAELVERANIITWEDCSKKVVAELKEICFWDLSEKTRLTKWDWETIFSMYAELNRQELFDINWEYEPQKTYTCSYGQNLKLKWTLDRDWKWNNKEKLRDTKSTASIKSFIWEWKDKLHYDFSMAFYWILKYQATWIKSELFLDVVQKTFPYASRVYQIPEQTTLAAIEEIKEALNTLDSIMTAYEKTWDENVWKVKTPFALQIECDFYSKMETTIQKNVEILQ